MSDFFSFHISDQRKEAKERRFIIYDEIRVKKHSLPMVGKVFLLKKGTSTLVKCKALPFH